MAHETEYRSSLSEAATQWWVCQGPEASPTERREFADWVMRGPEQIAAFLRVARAHSALTRSGLQLPDTPAGELIRAARASVSDPVPLRPHRAGERQTRHFGTWAFAGAVASLLVAVFLGWSTWLRPVQYETRLGEQRVVLLSDGSRVTLNTGSRIEVRFRANRRDVRLLAGEALFEVAHDTSRPFEVGTGVAVARAVGTQFDVYRRGESTEVTVIEGRVVILDAAASQQRPELPVLGKGDRVVVSPDGRAQLTQGVAIDAATAWLHGQLVISRRPLGDVAEEFNRYNAGRIDIRSPALRAQVVSGTFQSNDPASFVSFLESFPDVRVASDGRGGYVVTSP